MTTPKENKCSFCGRYRKDVQILIAGIEGHICESCTEQAEHIIEEELKSKHSESTYDFSLPTSMKPKNIVFFLNEYIIGQQDAKKTLSVAVYNHYKRLNQHTVSDESEVEIEKSNVLLVGHTGTGKTLLAKTIAKFLNVPFTIVDATVFTEAGYVGEDVESILSRLLEVSGYDPQVAEKGIIYIDEIDKITRKTDNPSITRDVSGEGVQQSLLKLLEGSEVKVPPKGGRKHPDQKMITINTKDILFIAGGAFEGIEKIIANRLNTSLIGFKSENETKVDTTNLLQYVGPKDIKKYGLIPEIIGRLPVIVNLDPLTEEALKNILIKPKNALIKQYKKLFEYDHIDLDFTPEAIDFIVQKAMEYNLGARGLRSICELIINDAMYELPSQEGISEFLVTLKFAQSKFNKLNISKLKVA